MAPLRQAFHFPHTRTDSETGRQTDRQSIRTHRGIAWRNPWHSQSTARLVLGLFQNYLQILYSEPRTSKLRSLCQDLKRRRKMRAKTQRGKKERDTSKLNGDNDNHSGRHYRAQSWPLSLIDPPERDTMTVTKSSPPLLLLDEPPFVLWTESYGESIIAKQKQPWRYTGRGDTLRHKTRSDWTASVWPTCFPSPLSALFPVSLRGLQLLSLYVWTVIDPPTPLLPALWHWYSLH